MRQKRQTTQREEVQALDYSPLLAKARAGADKVIEQQPQKPANPKHRKGERGEEYTLRRRMELAEIFLHLSRRTDVKVTPGTFHEFVHLPVSRKSIIQWNKDFDKFILMWRMAKATNVRNKDDVVSGLQLEAAAGSVLHIPTDFIYSFDDISHGRTISFTTSWRSRMTQEYGVAYCSLKGEAGSVDKDAIAERMNEIRNICSKNFELDGIYNCDETGMYLRELSTRSYTMEELASGAKPERGTAN
ncbi:hypothetical protein BGZ47_011451 [Haplosporangium gracile]|nr:hypothetical protein BGZ47_011451 [Haplosporangium gracile]